MSSYRSRALLAWEEPWDHGPTSPHSELSTHSGSCVLVGTYYISKYVRAAEERPNDDETALDVLR